MTRAKRLRTIGLGLHRNIWLGLKGWDYRTRATQEYMARAKRLGL